MISRRRRGWMTFIIRREPYGRRRNWRRSCTAPTGARFLVNGTTCGNEAMILSAAGPGEKIMVPRNAHKSGPHGIDLKRRQAGMDSAGISGGLGAVRGGNSPGCGRRIPPGAGLQGSISGKSHLLWDLQRHTGHRENMPQAPGPAAGGMRPMDPTSIFRKNFPRER